MKTLVFIVISITSSSAEVFVPKKLCGGDRPCGSANAPAQEKRWIKTEELPVEKVLSAGSETDHPEKPKKQSLPHNRVLSSAPPQTPVRSNEERTNLPAYLRGDRPATTSVDQVVMNTKGRDPRSGLVRAGDMVRAVIEQEIVASPSVPTPIRAMAISGPMKGAMFLGEARLDSELKRVLIEFVRIRPRDTSGTLNVRASGLSLKGSVGLEGDYVSHAGKFFIAELGAAVAAGAVDASIQRNQNSMGNYVQEPSVANQAKTGLATALARSADRAAEAVRQAPEYTKTEGYQEIQILIKDDPTDSGEV